MANYLSLKESFKLCTGPYKPSEMKTLVGPHIYFVYDRDENLCYIGKTENPSSRFQSHDNVYSSDTLWVIDLKIWMKKVKTAWPQWSSLKEDARRKSVEEIERIFLYMYYREHNTIPKRNSRSDMPSPGVMLFLEMLLGNSKAVTKSPETKSIENDSGRNWSSLKKSWQGFKIAKANGDQAKMAQYAQIINEIEESLGKKQTNFRF
jgi:hypothetical protein